MFNNFDALGKGLWKSFNYFIHNLILSFHIYTSGNKNLNLRLQSIKLIGRF